MSEVELDDTNSALDDVNTGDAGGADNEPSTEDRALSMGWTPKGQFKGDPEKWVDAETFVKRGEEFLPFLKANNKRLEQALERANAKVTGLEKAVQQSIEHMSRADKRAYEQAMRDIQGRLDTAAEAGDVEGVRAAATELTDLAKDAKAEAKPEDGEPAEVAAWRADNPWFDKDPAMRGAAKAICEEISAGGVKDYAKQLEIVSKRIREEFPHKFENPNRKAPAAVEGSGSPARKAAKTYADLPPEAKSMCDDQVRAIKGFTREKYVKFYFANEAH